MQPLDLAALHANYRPLDIDRLNALYAPNQAQAPQAQKKKGLSPGGLLADALKGVAHPFAEYGTALALVPKAIYREVQNKPIDDIQRRAFGTNDSKKIAKKILGDAGQIGLTVAAPAAKGIKASMGLGGAFGAASGVSDDSSLESTLNRALLGVALGGASYGVGKVAGKSLQKVTGKTPQTAVRPDSAPTGLAKKLDKAGGQLMNTQTRLTQSQARQIGVRPVDLYGNINKRYGLHSMDDMAEVGANVTGNNGIHSEAVRNAIGNGKGIDVGGREFTDKMEALVNAKGSAISDSARESLPKQVHNAIQAMYADQPLGTRGNPLAAFDIAKDWRGQAAMFNRGANPSGADKQMATIYNGMAKELEKRLYSQPGVAEVIPSIGKSMQKSYLSLAEKATNDTQKKAYIRLADEATKVKDLQSMRSLQQPWVQVLKLDEKTALSQGNQYANISPKGAISRISNAALNAAAPRIGAASSSLSQALSGGGAQLSNGASRAIAGGAGVLGGSLAGSIQRNNANKTPDDAGNAPDLMGGDMMAGGDMMGEAPPEQPTQDLYPLANAIADMQRDPKNASYYQTLYTFVNKAQQPPKAAASPYGKPAFKDVNLATTGMEGLQQLKGVIQSNPSVVTKSGTPGQGLPIIGGEIEKLAGTGEYNTLAQDVAKNALYLKTGATATPREIDSFMRTYIPQPGNTAKTIQTKLQRLESFFSRYSAVANQGSDSNDLTDILSQMQGAY